MNQPVLIWTPNQIMSGVCSDKIQSASGAEFAFMLEPETLIEESKKGRIVLICSSTEPGSFWVQHKELIAWYADWIRRKPNHATMNRANSTY